MAMLIDLRNKDVTGKVAEQALGRAHITLNKNMVPFDTQSPFVTSGIRVGTPAGHHAWRHGGSGLLEQIVERAESSCFMDGTNCSVYCSPEDEAIEIGRVGEAVACLSELRDLPLK